MTSENKISIDEITGFVTAMYERKWWLACILQVHQDDRKVSINILIPNGPSPSYKYPTKQTVVLVSIDDILTKLDPRTSYGRIYTISKEETKAATEQFKCMLKTAS